MEVFIFMHGRSVLVTIQTIVEDLFIFILVFFILQLSNTYAGQLKNISASNHIFVPSV